MRFCSFRGDYLFFSYTLSWFSSPLVEIWGSKSAKTWKVRICHLQQGSPLLSPSLTWSVRIRRTWLCVPRRTVTSTAQSHSRCRRAPNRNSHLVAGLQCVIWVRHEMSRIVAAGLPWGDLRVIAGSKSEREVRHGGGSFPQVSSWRHRSGQGRLGPEVVRFRWMSSVRVVNRGGDCDTMGP